MQLPNNINGVFNSEPHNNEKVYKAFPGVKLGVVKSIENLRDGQLGNNGYVVELMDGTGTNLTGVKATNFGGGTNGTGIITSYHPGDTVILAFPENILGNGNSYIIGGFNTEGNYSTYYTDGKLQEVNENSEYNQIFNHPNRIVEPDATFIVAKDKTLRQAWASSEYGSAEESLANQAPPGAFQMFNAQGDVATYAPNSIIHYTDGNIIQVAGGSNETKTAKLLRFSENHCKKSQAFTQTQPSDFKPDEVTTEMKPLVDVASVKAPAKEQAISLKYRGEQEQLLCEFYRNAAQQNNLSVAANVSQAGALTNQYGSELDPKATKTQVAPNVTFPESNASISSKNWRKGRLAPKGTPVILVLHETVVDYDTTIKFFNDPNRKTSYHVLIKEDGSLVNLVSPKDTAFGSGKSQFNGLIIRNGVNDFAYQVSLVSPADRNIDIPKDPNHKGYTSAQYQSLAKLAAKSGIPYERITTHEKVGTATGKDKHWDPWKFSFETFKGFYDQFPKTKEIDFGLGESVSKSSNTLYGHYPYAENPQNRLVVVGTYNGRSESLDKEAATAFRNMKDVALSSGVDLRIISGFRSIATQKTLWANQVSRRGSKEEAAKYSAPPGYSEHATGYTLDIGDGANPKTDVKVDFQNTKAGIWLKSNASKFGFDMPFTPGNSQGVSHEPWHWRYKGSDRAKQIFKY